MNMAINPSNALSSLTIRRITIAPRRRIAAAMVLMRVAPQATWVSLTYPVSAERGVAFSGVSE